MLFLQYLQVHTQINFGAVITIDKLILHAYTEVLGYGPTQLNHITKYLSSIHVSLLQVNIALRCFLHNHDNIAKDGRDYALPLSNNCLHSFFYSAQCHRHHCTLHTFQQFGALYMHNLDDKHPTRPGLEPSSSEFRATAGSNGPSGRPRYSKHKQTYCGSYYCCIKYI